jgi:plasmid stability protein
MSRCAVASLTIRNFDDELKALLRLQAARHGCSMEQEARDILRREVSSNVPASGFAQRIHLRFAALDGGGDALPDELPIPKRRAVRQPDVLKD